MCKSGDITTLIFTASTGRFFQLHISTILTLLHHRQQHNGAQQHGGLHNRQGFHVSAALSVGGGFDTDENRRGWGLRPLLYSYGFAQSASERVCPGSFRAYVSVCLIMHTSGWRLAGGAAKNGGVKQIAHTDRRLMCVECVIVIGQRVTVELAGRSGRAHPLGEGGFRANARARARQKKLCRARSSVWLALTPSPLRLRYREPHTCERRAHTRATHGGESERMDTHTRDAEHSCSGRVLD